MAEQASSGQSGPVNTGIVRDLKANEQKLALHLENGEPLTGTIALFDKFNVIVEAEGGKCFGMPKHAVAHAELL